MSDDYPSNRLSDYELSHLILRFEQEKDMKPMHCVQNLAALRDLVAARIELTGLRSHLAALESEPRYTFATEYELEISRLHQQDRIKTAEINTLVKENRQQADDLRILSFRMRHREDLNRRLIVERDDANKIAAAAKAQNERLVAALESAGRGGLYCLNCGNGMGCDDGKYWCLTCDASVSVNPPHCGQPLPQPYKEEADVQS